MELVKRILVLAVLGLGLGQMLMAQVIQPPVLQCVDNNNTNGNITLSWTDPPNNPCGAFVQYTIYGSSTGPNGPYDSIIAVTSQAANSVTLTNYLAVSQTWYFYMVADYNCPGATVLASDTINNLYPATPQIVNVTVTNGQAVLNWLPSASPQASFYIVYQYLPNGQGVPIDTIYGRLNTTATDTSSFRNPDVRSYSYTVAAADSCGKFSSFNTAPHNTLYTDAKVTSCHQQMTINWNRYINWPQGVAGYRIYLSDNGSPYTLITETDSGTLFYLYTNFNDGDTIKLYVQALSLADSNITSISNVDSFRATIVQPPSYLYITNLTVDTNNYVDVTWTIDTTAQLFFYKIYRSAGDSINYIDDDEFNAPSPLPHFETFVDSSSQPQTNPYYYYVVGYDSCNNQYLSPEGEDVNLMGLLYDYYIIQLTWNNFYLPYATVQYYNLYRDYGSGYQLIKTFQPGTNLYYDSVQQFIGQKGTFCYQIEAVYSIGLPPPSNYHANLTSYSNTTCVVHRPVIYIPNAFSPGSNVGVNQTFKPTLIYSDPHNYSMAIFDRWGAEIFSTNDPNIGWDGTDHGEPATMGGYAYLIKFTSDDGVLVQNDGMVMLVR